VQAFTHVVSGLESPCGDGYRVAWRINPHMRVGSTRPARARAQHDAFRSALIAAGARLLELPFVPGAYDCVFMKDPALLVRREDGSAGALLARARHRERAEEFAARRWQLEAAGFAVDGCESRLEGGDVVRVGERYLLGHGFRSERRAAAALERFTGREVLPLRLTDAALYHLDTAVAYLSGGELLVAEGAIADRDLRALERFQGVRHLEVIPRSQAMAFAANLVQIGDRVILASGAPHMESRLVAWGYRPVVIELDQFIAAGGSAACLVAEVHGPGLSAAGMSTASAAAA